MFGCDVGVRAANAGLTDSRPLFPLCSVLEVNGALCAAESAWGVGVERPALVILARTEGRGARSGSLKLVVGSLQVQFLRRESLGKASVTL